MLNPVVHPGPASMAEQVAELLAVACRAGLDARGQAWLALAGGATPLPVYRRLSERVPDGGNIHAVPTDERWVEAGHEASNHRALAAELDACGMDLRCLCPDEPGPEPETGVARQSLAGLDGAFDGVLVGMGPDGHFASLFPRVPELAVALDPGANTDVVAVTPDPLPPEAPYARISLTLSRLLDARRILLVVRGTAKLEVLARASAHDADPLEYPVSALIRHAGPALQVHWSP